MKKLALTLAPFLGFATMAPSAFAATLCPTDKFSALCSTNLSNIIVAFINLIFIFAVIVALLYLIWGGFKWLTSGGDKSAVQSAREHVIAAIVGLVIIFLSYFILNILVKFFVPGFDITTFQIPSITNPNANQ